ncbi:selenium cofactor biosynthesis protein YqeC [Natranaerofaba carboxydovora]|uniref:selenium cofactor biosynthesis protein YqeC n=1 Tax=Natranaerofaba carboxydovora TaxID=2742683 RepID=UPI001F12BC99|nr:selenium cofactor biosynthesis protein YqeC [Natranaerofaba carboxydovora]UMZ74814.1 TIGR03172: putative selenium-dependent hydroxylase accessory protein YqeC [Natranaerofaba carboxydovora]
MLIEGMSLGFDDRVISVVGGGGKTSFILRLAGELTMEERVIITTTTQMEHLCPKKVDKYIISDDLKQVKKELKTINPDDKTIFLASKKIAGNKVEGVPTKWIKELKEFVKTEGLVESMIVEADGAKRKPLKGGFLENEPVIPGGTDVVVMMTGIDAVDKKLTEEHVHRAELAAKITGLKIGSVLKENYFRKIIEYTSLRASKMSFDARVILFINKVDTEKELNKALPIVSKLAKSDKIKFDRIILGTLKAMNPVQKVLN